MKCRGQRLSGRSVTSASSLQTLRLSPNQVIPGHTDVNATLRLPKSHFNLPMSKADFARTHGIWLFDSPDPEPFRKSCMQYHRDLNQLAGSEACRSTGSKGGDRSLMWGRSW